MLSSTCHVSLGLPVTFAIPGEQKKNDSTAYLNVGPNPRILEETYKNSCFTHVCSSCKNDFKACSDHGRIVVCVLANVTFELFVLPLEDQ